VGVWQDYLAGQGGNKLKNAMEAFGPLIAMAHLLPANGATARDGFFIRSSALGWTKTTCFAFILDSADGGSYQTPLALTQLPRTKRNL